MGDGVDMNDALKHEITVLRRLLAERESNVRFLYARLRKVCMYFGEGNLRECDLRKIKEIVADVRGWPMNADDLFKF